ncbi:MAG: hypothetical protein NDJ90_07610 [Oligoflexia bacterium]|nr:hypothetical protein [Oligoflexia bacterium]
MKFTIAILIVFAALSGPFAHAAEPGETYSCLINKSYSFVVELERENGRVSAAWIREKHFLDKDGELVATLANPRVIEYGRVLILAQDFGRSGYAFVRLERRNDDEYEGWFDLNLLTNQSGVAMGGTLYRTDCFRLR